MNMRCYRCGWSFTLGREAVAAAVANANATGAKHHVEHCPRCRQALKIPLDQLKRSLPLGWRSPEPAIPTAPAVEPAAPAPEPASASAPLEPLPDPAVEAEGPPQAKEKPRRRHSSRNTARKTGEKGAASTRTTAATPLAASKRTRKRPKS